MTDKEMIKELEQKGYGVIPPDRFLIDMEEDFKIIWAGISAYTMTSVERGYSLYKAVRYVVENGIDGDFVECGVWKGGSCMLMAKALLHMGVTDRKIYLYDTFEGMTEPGDNDFIAWNGRSVKEKWEEDRRGIKNNFASWSIGLEEVKKNIAETEYPAENLEYVKGPVEQTLLGKIPEQISLLRLDTDWYQSTRIELEHLYPRLLTGGILILDDYGHFTGAKQAVDEYFSEIDEPVYLNRIDYTGRTSVKIR